MSRHLLVGIALIALIAPSTLVARQDTTRLRWVPNNDPRLTGYRVYSRQAGHAYGTFIDAGRPTLAEAVSREVADGLVRFFEG